MVQRPERLLIDIINDMDFEQLLAVSPASKYLKKFIKVPMLTCLQVSTMQSALGAVMFKLWAELMCSGEWRTNLLLMFVMWVFLVLSCALQIHLLNKAIKYYD